MVRSLCLSVVVVAALLAGVPARVQAQGEGTSNGNANSNVFDPTVPMLTRAQAEAFLPPPVKVVDLSKPWMVYKSTDPLIAAAVSQYLSTIKAPHDQFGNLITKNYKSATLPDTVDPQVIAAIATFVGNQRFLALSPRAAQSLAATQHIQRQKDIDAIIYNDWKAKVERKAADFNNRPRPRANGNGNANTAGPGPSSNPLPTTPPSPAPTPAPTPTPAPNPSASPAPSPSASPAPSPSASPAPSPSASPAPSPSASPAPSPSASPGPAAPTNTNANGNANQTNGNGNNTNTGGNANQNNGNVGGGNENVPNLNNQTNGNASGNSNNTNANSNTTGGGAPTAQQLAAEFNVIIPSQPQAWTPTELTDLRDVLSKLPREFYQGLELKRAAGISPSEGAPPDPNILGVCFNSGDTAGDVTIADGFRDTDRGTKQDWPNPPWSDEDGIRIQMKAILAHEITHNFQFYGTGRRLSNLQESPVVQNFAQTFGWTFDSATSQWAFDPTRRDERSSQYAIGTPTEPTSPMEDMAEAVAFYLYDPVRLQATAARNTSRFDWVRDNLRVLATTPDPTHTVGTPAARRLGN